MIGGIGVVFYGRVLLLYQQETCVYTCMRKTGPDLCHFFGSTNVQVRYRMS
jgi:hypothetical protein